MEMMNNLTLYPAHSDTQVVIAENAYLLLIHFTIFKLFYHISNRILLTEINIRAVITDINRNVAATLKLCGPSILTQGKFAEQTISILASIITKSHPCQQDIGDEADQSPEDEESSEYDWLVIDTALDVVIGLAAALGSQFSEAWKIFQKPVMKYASSQTNYERSTAIGVIAECTAHMGNGVSPFTAPLLKLLLHRLTDEDDETKSNASYAIGLLIYHSTDSNTYLPAFKEILRKLEPLLHTRVQGHSTTLLDVFAV
jgi:hypothetical protein